MPSCNGRSGCEYHDCYCKLDNCLNCRRYREYCTINNFKIRFLCFNCRSQSVLKFYNDCQDAYRDEKEKRMNEKGFMVYTYPFNKIEYEKSVKYIRQLPDRYYTYKNCAYCNSEMQYVHNNISIPKKK